MPRFFPYVIVVGLFVLALLYLQFRDRSYLEDIARSAYPPPPASRVILPPPQEAQGPLLYISGNRVAFRSAPGLQKPVIERFDKGRTLRQTDVSGDWVHVRDVDTGRMGWVAGEYLTPTNPMQAASSN
ncbi:MULTISPECIES: SH3 domain-containing protein [unclassified Roseibium]|uniref:SH3 domain-containing protein n=1 Tax=unclassified Roseibium TaxID=2629323 RepID=UPI00316C1DCD